MKRLFIPLALFLLAQPVSADEVNFMVTANVIGLLQGKTDILINNQFATNDPFEIAAAIHNEEEKYTGADFTLTNKVNHNTLQLESVITGGKFNIDMSFNDKHWIEEQSLNKWKYPEQGLLTVVQDSGIINKDAEKFMAN